MPDDGCRVRDLLPDRFDDLDKVVGDELCAADGQKPPPAMALRIAGDKAAEAVRDALDCDLFETLAKAWCTALELREYKDPTRHPPGERSSVFLAEHKLTATLHPVLDVRIAALCQAKLRFTVELKAAFRCADLTIQDGCIVEIGAGDCQATAQLKYGDVPLHEELKSRQVALSQPRKLPAPGLAIV